MDPINPNLMTRLYLEKRIDASLIEQARAGDQRIMWAVQDKLVRAVAEYLVHHLSMEDFDAGHGTIIRTLEIDIVVGSRHAYRDAIMRARADGAQLERESPPALFRRLTDDDVLPGGK